MTITANGGRWPWLNRPAMWLGHYQSFFLLGTLGLTIVFDAIGNPGPVTWVAAAAFGAWMVALVADIAAHQRQLCERCISAAPTLNPQAAVERWPRALWCHHQKRMNIVLLAVALGCIFGWGQVHHQWPWGDALDAAGLLIVGYSVVTGHVHQRLYPWCPWCHWGDGGGEEIAPVAPEDHGVLL